MRLTLNTISRFIINDFDIPSEVNERSYLSASYYSTTGFTPVYICNPYLDTDKNVWRNVVPIKAFIRPHNYCYKDFNSLSTILSDPNNVSYSWATKFKRGLYALLLKSLYSGCECYQFNIVNLEYALDLNSKMPISNIAGSPDYYNKYISKYFAIFDNLTEASSYIRQVKKNSTGEEELLESKIRFETRLIEEAMSRKEALQKELLKLKQKNGRLENTP